MCRVLGISRSSYYKWLQRAPGALEQENEQIKRDIIAIYNKYKGIYGYRRICIYIRINLGKKINHKRVYRLMKLLNLKAIIRRKRPHYQRSTPRITKENKLNRCFNVTSPNTTWLTDVTEFRIRDGRKVYLSAIYDLGSKKIVSYELGKSNSTSLATRTLDKAILKVNSTVGILFHSDRGFQYTSHVFRDKLVKYGFEQSMSRVGKCIDNGPMEGLWGTIKSEIYRGNQHFSFNNFEEAQQKISNYIQFFNKERITLKMADFA